MKINKMKNTKAQAALEFLSTYGWALMVVMVMIAALAYFGVLNPTRVLPERCIFGNGLNCGDWAIYKDQGTSQNAAVGVKLMNALGQTIYVDYAEIEFNGAVVGCSTVPGSEEELPADANVQIYCRSSDVVVGEKKKAKISFYYKKSIDGFKQVSLGDVYATAQNGGFCDATEAHCSDTILDCGETGLDCGGTCSNKCGAGQSCDTGDDCISNNCCRGVCFSNSRLCQVQAIR